ncbi:Myb domain protein 4r1, partial [Tanacetum coccineum]
VAEKEKPKEHNSAQPAGVQGKSPLFCQDQVNPVNLAIPARPVREPDRTAKGIRKCTWISTITVEYGTKKGDPKHELDFPFKVKYENQKGSPVSAQELSLLRFYMRTKKGILKCTWISPLRLIMGTEKGILKCTRISPIKVEYGNQKGDPTLNIDIPIKVKYGNKKGDPKLNIDIPIMVHVYFEIHLEDSNIDPDVKPKYFLAILAGDEKAVGEKKVMKSTANDHVFVYYAGHGGKEILDMLTVELEKSYFLETRWKTLFLHEALLLKKARDRQKYSAPSNFVDQEEERPTFVFKDIFSSLLLESRLKAKQDKIILENTKRGEGGRGFDRSHANLIAK